MGTNRLIQVLDIGGIRVLIIALSSAKLHVNCIDDGPKVIRGMQLKVSALERLPN